MRALPETSGNHIIIASGMKSHVLVLGHCEPVLMGLMGSEPKTTVRHKYTNRNYMLKRLLKYFFLIIIVH